MHSEVSPDPDGPSPETIAFCLLLAAALQIIENLLPKIPIFPWFRFGLAHWVLLPFMLRFGAFHALLLFMGRNIITLIYGAQIPTAFLISSISGAITLGLAGHMVCRMYHKKILGLAGASILLAACFNLTQLVVVDRLFIRHFGLYFQLSPLLAWSIVSGGIIAFLVYKGESALAGVFDSGKRKNLFGDIAPVRRTPDFNRFRIAGIAVIFSLLWLLNDYRLQLGVTAVMIGIHASAYKRTFKLLIRILVMAWPFYFYIAWLHLFKSDGIYIYRDWITREGLIGFILHAARLTNVIICGQWLVSAIPYIWGKSGQHRHLQGLGMAVPLLPPLFGISISLGKEAFHRIRRRRLSGLFEDMILRLERELGQYVRFMHNGHVDESLQRDTS